MNLRLLVQLFAFMKINVYFWYENLLMN